MLALHFTTLVEYLFLLRTACKAVKDYERQVVVYAAAAVSDFYQPAVQMATDKIQSRAGNGLQLDLAPGKSGFGKQGKERQRGSTVCRG